MAHRYEVNDDQQHLAATQDNCSSQAHQQSPHASAPPASQPPVVEGIPMPGYPMQQPAMHQYPPGAGIYPHMQPQYGVTPPIVMVMPSVQPVSIEEREKRDRLNRETMYLSCALAWWCLIGLFVFICLFANWYDKNGGGSGRISFWKFSSGSMYGMEIEVSVGDINCSSLRAHIQAAAAFHIAAITLCGCIVLFHAYRIPNNHRGATWEASRNGFRIHLGLHVAAAFAMMMSWVLMLTIGDSDCGSQLEQNYSYNGIGRLAIVAWAFMLVGLLSLVFARYQVKLNL